MTVMGAIFFRERRTASRLHWAWIVLASSFITLFVNYSIRIGAYSILLPKMIEDLQINLVEAGLIRTAYFLAYVLGSPFMGWLTDRMGGRWVISFFSLFLGTGTFLMGLVPNLPYAILCYGMVGLGAAAIWTPTVTLIQRWFSASRRGMALGILSPSYAIGFGLMGLILPWMIETTGWRMAWFLLGITGWGLVLLNGLLLRNDPGEMALQPWGDTEKSSVPFSHPQRRDLFGSLLRRATFWWMGLSYFFISLAAYMISDFVVAYSVMELQIDHGKASGLLTIMAASGILGGFSLMWLSDFIGRKKALFIIHITLAMSILWILLVQGDFFLLRIGIAGFGFLFGAIWPMYGACTRDYFPKEVTGSVFGIMTIFYGLGAMVNPLLTGLMVDHTGSFRGAFGMGILSSSVAALVVTGLKKPLDLKGH